MRKRLLSILLSVCMVLTLLPTVAFAETIDYGIWVGTTRVTGGNADNVTGDGITGTGTYNAGTNTLTLNNASITTLKPSGNDQNGNINNNSGVTNYAKRTNNGKTVRTTALDLGDISGDNLYGSTKSGNVYTNTAEGWTWYTAQTTVDGETYAAKTLVLSGLTVHTAEAVALNVPGGTTIILMEGTTSILEGGNVSIHDNDAYAYGIHGEGALNIRGSGALIVNVGNVSHTGNSGSCISAGIFNQGALTIGGGVTVTAVAGAATTTKGDGSGSIGIYSYGKLAISGGRVSATGGNADSSAGIAGSAVEIIGGTVTAKNDIASTGGAAIFAGASLTVGSIDQPAMIANATDGINTITASSGAVTSQMLVMSGDDAVSISFAAYAITANAAAHGSYTVKVDGSAVTSAQSGETVTITPTAAGGYEADTISVYKTEDSNTAVTVTNSSFTMPAYAVTINVAFKAAIGSLDLSGVGCNVAAGKLTGTTANMEYSLDGGSTWHGCTAGNTTGLTFVAGIVKVRQKDNTSNERIVITIAAPAASNTPMLNSKTDNSVTLTAMTGYEYSKDGGTTWQDSTIFSGLSSSTAYSFVARIKATAAALPGTISTTLNVTTNSASYGGGSDTPSQPVDTKPTEPVSGSTESKAGVDDKGNATVGLTEKNITDAIADAKAEAAKKGVNPGGITAVIHVTTSGKNANTVKANLPKTVQDAILANKIVNTIVVVDNPGISIGMDLATVQEINKQAKSDVNITVTRMDNSKLTGEAEKAIGSRPVFDLKVNYGRGGQVQSFGAGSVLIAIPYTLGTNEKSENMQAVYVDGKGKVHWLASSVYNRAEKVLRFHTNHFSVYGIAYAEELSAGEPARDSGTEINPNAGPDGFSKRLALACSGVAFLYRSCPAE